jgi:hypothetical protein
MQHSDVPSAVETVPYMVATPISILNLDIPKNSTPRAIKFAAEFNSRNFLQIRTNLTT